jgi:hypothetical protein
VVGVIIFIKYPARPNINPKRLYNKYTMIDETGKAKRNIEACDI